MRLTKSFRDASRGIWIAFRDQPNMKIHFLAIICVGILGVYFKFSSIEWCLVTLSIGLVVGFEVMNSSVEELVNIVSPEKRREAGSIKDMAAGAVLVAAIASIILFFVIIIPKI